MKSSLSGYLSLYFGCMYAGKSKRLIMKLSKKHDLGFKVVYITHREDNRTTEGSNSTITTHWSCFAQANVALPCYRTYSLSLIYELLKEFDIIGVDEFQFFPSADMDIIKKLINIEHKVIYCASLDTNFKGEKFGSILDLIPIADKVKKIHAKCMFCRKEGHIVSALFTAKIAGNMTKIKEVGAKEIYTPLCRSHYLEYNKSLVN